MTSRRSEQRDDAETPSPASRVDPDDAGASTSAPASPEASEGRRDLGDEGERRRALWAHVEHVLADAARGEPLRLDLAAKLLERLVRDLRDVDLVLAGALGRLCWELLRRDSEGVLARAEAWGAEARRDPLAGLRAATQSLKDFNGPTNAETYRAVVDVFVPLIPRLRGAQERSVTWEELVAAGRAAVAEADARAAFAQQRREREEVEREQRREVARAFSAHEDEALVGAALRELVIARGRVTLHEAARFLREPVGGLMLPALQVARSGTGIRIGQRNFPWGPVVLRVRDEEYAGAHALGLLYGDAAMVTP